MAGTHYAVLIGNDTFPNDERLVALKCPLNDVRAMADMLGSAKHGPYKVSTLENKSRSVILEELCSVLTEADDDDRVLIFFAGHGRLSANGGRLYLAAENTRTQTLPATGVPVDEIYNYMRDSRSSQLILILDCCYSGAIEKVFGGGNFRGESAQQVDAHLSVAGGTGSYILTASSGTQTAEEREADGHGLLTKHILGGIRDGQADRDDDGDVSMHELTRYVQAQIKAEGRQTPLSFTLHEKNGGIVLARTGKADRSRKMEELQDRIFRYGVKGQVTARTVGAVMTILSPEATLSAGQLTQRQSFIDRLYASLAHFRRFNTILEEAAPLAISLRDPGSGVNVVVLEQERDAAREQAAALERRLEEEQAAVGEESATLREQVVSLVTRHDEDVRRLAEAAALQVETRQESERFFGKLRLYETKAKRDETALRIYAEKEREAEKHAASSAAAIKELEDKCSALAAEAEVHATAQATAQTLATTSQWKLRRAIEQAEQAEKKVEELSALLQKSQLAEKDLTKATKEQEKALALLQAKLVKQESEKEIVQTSKEREKTLVSLREKVTKQDEEIRESKTALRDARTELSAVTKREGNARKSFEQLTAHFGQEQAARLAAEEELRQANSLLGPLRVQENAQRDKQELARKQAEVEVLLTTILGRPRMSGALVMAADIPGNKMQVARSRARVPESAVVLAGIDNTVFSSMKNCILFTADCLYSVQGSYVVECKYSALPKRDGIDYEGADSIKFGGMVLYLLLSQGLYDLIELLGELREVALKQPRTPSRNSPRTSPARSWGA